MDIKIKQKNKFATIILITMLGTGVSFSLWKIEKAIAESITNLSNNKQDNSGSGCGFLEDESEEKATCEEYEKRAAMYREIIETKGKQAESYMNQLSITDSNIGEIQAEIGISKQKIDDYNSQISRIERQVKEKNELMEAQRNMLAKLMQSYYEVNLASPVISYLNDGNIASFIVKKDRIAQTGDKIKGLIDSVKKIKEDFEAQNKELDKKKSEVVLTHEELKDQSGDLEAIKNQKEKLIAQTKGEEARYQQLLARVEAQKQELLDFSTVGDISSILGSVANYPKPDSKYSNSSSYYSQRDSRWAEKKIGGTRYRMADFGCAVTSVAMAYKFNASNTTPQTVLSSADFTNQALIFWPSGWYNSGKVANVNWSGVDAELAKKNVVIAHIKTSSGPGHYVVIHNKDKKDYVVHDPYFGANLYLKTSMALMSATSGGSSTKIDQVIFYR